MDLVEKFGKGPEAVYQFNHTSLGWNPCVHFEENMKGNQFVAAARKFYGGMNALKLLTQLPGLPYYAYVNPFHEDFLKENFGTYLYYFLARYLFRY